MDRSSNRRIHDPLQTLIDRIRNHPRYNDQIERQLSNIMINYYHTTAIQHLQRLLDFLDGQSDGNKNIKGKGNPKIICLF